MNTKISFLALGAALAFSGSALAAGDAWDSIAPWGSAELAQFAEWNNFDSATFDNTPDVGAGTISLSPTGGFLVDANIYTMFSVPTITVNLTGSSGVFDVYLRTANQGRLLNSTATLNGISATSVLAYSGSADLGSGNEQELYWVWNNVTGSDLYTFQFSAASAHVLLDQVAVATVAVAAVPEPSSYAMLALGLGILGAAARRRKQS